jgi:hypothetical protein
MKASVVAGLLLLAVSLGSLAYLAAWLVLPGPAAYDPAWQEDGQQRTTLPLDRLQALVAEQLSYVEKNVPKGFSCDAAALAALTDAATRPEATYNSLAALFNLTPWYALGYWPALPLRGPLQLNTFQFGQGINGWFWFIARSENIQAFVSFGRTTVASPAVLPPLVRPEEASFYSVSVMVQGTAVKGLLLGPNNVSGPGTYQLNAQGGFSLNMPQPPNESGAAAALSSASLDYNAPAKTYRLSVGWTQGVGGAADALLTAVFDCSERPPSFNAKDGCLCVDGMGTPYYSYTSPKTSGTFKRGSDSLVTFSGEGWIDRQLGGGVPRKGDVLMLLQLQTPLLGLGPYLWMNLHLRQAQQQYMVYGVVADAPKLDDRLKVSVVKYPSQKPGTTQREPVYDLEAHATVKATTRVGDVDYPSMYLVEIAGEDPLLATAVMGGPPVYTDGSGNPHWAGAASLVAQKDNADVGWAFLEGSGFEPPATLWANCVEAAKVRGPDRHLWPPDNSANRNRVLWRLASFFAALLALALAIVLLLRGRLAGAPEKPLEGLRHA